MGPLAWAPALGGLRWVFPLLRGSLTGGLSPLDWHLAFWPVLTTP